MKTRLGWTIFVFCIAGQAAPAATAVLPPPQAAGADGAGVRGTPLRVQVAYQLSVPVDRGSIDDQKAATARAHEALYAMAARECEQVRAVVPGECRMVSLSLNGGGPFFNAQNPSMSFGANVTLDVTPQAGAPAP